MVLGNCGILLIDIGLNFLFCIKLVIIIFEILLGILFCFFYLNGIILMGWVLLMFLVIIIFKDVDMLVLNVIVISVIYKFSFFILL